MPRSSPGPRRSRPMPPPPTPRGVALTEAAESMASTFDEACAHALALPESRDLGAGPLVPIPLSELTPGAMGWSRRIRFPPAGAPSEGDLFLVLFPAPAGGEGAGLPLRGIAPSALAFVQELAGPPRAVLLARALSGASAARLAAFAHAVGDEIVQE